MCRHFLLAVAAGVAILSGGPARAQNDRPPSAAEIAEARANADALIAQASVGDVFENVTETGQPKLRHRASGMTCTIRDDLRTVVLKVYDGLPRGDDVSCGSTVANVTETLYATRYPTAMSAEEAVSGSISEIRQFFDDLQPYRGDYATVSGEQGLPEPARARFQAKFKGKPVFTRTSALVFGEWVIAQRITAPLDMAVLADAIAELNLRQTMEDLAQPPAPSGSAPKM